MFANSQDPRLEDACAVTRKIPVFISAVRPAFERDRPATALPESCKKRSGDGGDYVWNRRDIK